MEIIARRGEDQYLLAEDAGAKVGRVLDMARLKLHPEFNLRSLLARGYWEQFEGSQELLAELLREAGVPAFA